VEPRPIPDPPARKGALLEEGLPAQLKNNPALTLEEHREAFEEQHGVEVSTATVSGQIRGLDQGFRVRSLRRAFLGTHAKVGANPGEVDILWAPTKPRGSGS
jgi:hypothetical protein